VKLEEVTDTEIGKKILASVGVSKTGSSNSTATTEAEPRVEQGESQGQTGKQTGSSSAIATTNKPSTTIQVQNHLVDLGYLSEKPDGVLGKKTTEALSKFQQSNGLAATGRVDGATSDALRGASK
jgi:peptidoglycan hydrolase-like protein with peptidoglycan-binding domain